MGNLAETKPMSTLIIEVGGEEYVFAGGGGVEPGVPLPDDTVGSNAIIDGAVQEEDLHDDVKAKIQKTYDQDDETMYMDFDKADVNNSQDVGQGGGEDEDLDDETGFETGADDGEGDI